MVLLSAENLKTTQLSKKLAHRRIGPFEVIKRYSKQAYELKLPPRYKTIHNVFHVSLLEPYRRRPGAVPEEIVPDIVAGEEVWTVEKVLDYKVDYKGGKPKDYYLVRWEGFGPEADQWVQKKDFTSDELIQEYHKKHPKEKPQEQTKEWTGAPPAKHRRKRQKRG